MNEWPQHIRDKWFVAARSEEIATKPVAVTILDTPIVLARLKGGTLVAFEDRCPHRHVPLSHGRITADGVECPYHGWTFGAGGTCTKIPGLIHCGNTTPRVPSYGVTERDGLAWVKLKPNAETMLPALVTRTPPEQRRFLWQTLWHAPVVDCLENFLDAMHTHYTHAGLVRKSTQRRRVTATLTTNTEGFTVDYQGPAVQSGLLYRLFESPRLSERALFAAPGVAQIEYCYANGSIVRITLYFTPRDESSTHVFTTLHVAGRWAPAWAVKLFVWPFLHKVATQDAGILALQSANRAKFQPQRFASSVNDFVRPYLEATWTATPDKTVLDSFRCVELSI
jgi:phenylpropionate dioxygenase-like ring-hydroxylating dioxygenase large terminal subunit